MKDWVWKAAQGNVLQAYWENAECNSSGITSLVNNFAKRLRILKAYGTVKIKFLQGLGRVSQRLIHTYFNNFS